MLIQKYMMWNSNLFKSADGHNILICFCVCVMDNKKEKYIIGDVKSYEIHTRYNYVKIILIILKAYFNLVLRCINLETQDIAYKC